MKKLIYIFLSVILILTGVWISDGQCQQFFGNKALVAILNANHHPVYGSGTFFLIGILSDINQMNGVKKITAENSNPNVDNNVYEFSLTPSIRNFNYEWDSDKEEFSGQHGTYKVTVEKGDGSSVTLPTDNIPEGLIPLPIPKNLRVSFEEGPTNPTLSFDPVTGVDFDLYDIRIFDKDFSRRIYRTKIFAGEEPRITFPASRFGGQTAEELVPGEKYIFKVDIWKILNGDRNCGMCSLLQSSNFKVFKIPEKCMTDHYGR